MIKSFPRKNATWANNTYSSWYNGSELVRFRKQIQIATRRYISGAPAPMWFKALLGWHGTPEALADLIQWDYSLSVDHIYPLAECGSFDEIAKCAHWSNLQTLSLSKNKIKHTTLPPKTHYYDSNLKAWTNVYNYIPEHPFAQDRDYSIYEATNVA